MFSVEVIDCCSNGKDAVEHARDPYELLGEITCAEKVCPRQDERDREHKNEENQRVCVESKVVAAAVDAAAIEASIAGILVNRDARDRNVAQENGDELSPVLSSGQNLCEISSLTNKPAHMSLNLGFSILKSSS